jgi:hypothetical protein
MLKFMCCQINKIRLAHPVCFCIGGSSHSVLRPHVGHSARAHSMRITCSHWNDHDYTMSHTLPSVYDLLFVDATLTVQAVCHWLP